jgi:hypothetical protein
MKTFTKQQLKNAYWTGATEVAEQLVSNVHNQAKFSPGCTTYAEKQYIDGLVAKTALELLKNALVGVDVQMKFTPDKDEDSCNKGFAFFLINWS